jgi:FkbM family methyltransferase
MSVWPESNPGVQSPLSQALKVRLPMPLLKKLFSRNRKFKTLKRETAASRFVAILEQNRIDTVIDVGANTGQTAEELRKFGYRGAVISYEPIRECHEELLVKSASDPGWSIAPRCALGDREGTVDFQVSEGSSLSSISSPTSTMMQALPKVRAASQEKVPIHRLDGLMKKEMKALGRVFLKIDAQGHDMAVLRGAEGIMKSLAGVKIEMSLLPLYEGETLYLDILKYLHEKGLSPHLLVDVGYSKKLVRQLQIDGVFMRDA